MYKVLLLGKSGLLGSAFYKAAANLNIKLAAPSHSELDLSSRDCVVSFLKSKNFDFVINCTGYNSVDAAEVNVEDCLELNLNVPAFLAEYLAENDLETRLIQFSSDYVFDGENTGGYNENALKNPLSVYGQSKNLMEEALVVSGCNWSVIRISWLFGPGKSNFFSKLLDGKLSNIISNQFGKITYTEDVAKFVLGNLEKFENEYYHLANEGVESWYEFAGYALKVASRDVKIDPILIEDLNLLAKRPKHSILLNEKLPKLRNWKEAVEDYVNNYIQV
jgi:dTDP-4-dehydrorhamnose reductase